LVNHQQRMRDLARYFVSDYRDSPPEWRAFVEGRNRTERRAWKGRVRKFFQNASSQVSAILENGAGLIADQVLRDMLFEYNDRNWAHGLGALPPSFNVLEAFVTYNARENWFGLRPERDHIFSLGDFLDFVTSPDAPSDKIAVADAIPQGEIHSYNAVGNLKDLAFLHADGGRYVAGAITFVRLNDELSWLLIGGPETDIKAESERIAAQWKKERPHFISEKHLDDPSRFAEAEAVCLPGTDDVWKTHLFGRLNLTTRKHEVRYLAYDHGYGYETDTDDPAVFPETSRGAPLLPESVRTLEKGQRIPNENLILTEIAETCFALPAYFRFKIQLVRERQQPTRLAAPSPATRRDIEHARQDQRVLYRKVAALEIIDIGLPPVVRAYAPPRFQVEVDGFWRRLSSPNSVGRGPNGETVNGHLGAGAYALARQPASNTDGIRQVLGSACTS
jgi:hypothetical protein